MLSVVLTVLKVLGIILLCVLGLLLLLINLLLFVPIRYKVNGEGDWEKTATDGNKIQASGKITWLLHLLSINADVDQSGFGAKVRVFGIPIIRMGNAEKPHKEKPGKKKKQDIKEDELNEVFVENLPVSEMTPVPDAPVQETPAAEALQKEEAKQEAPVMPAEEKPSETSAVVEVMQGEMHESSKEAAPEAVSKEDKLSKILEKVYNKFSNIADKLISKFNELASKVKNILGKVDTVKEFLEADENKAMFGLVLNRLVKLLRHYLPRKLDGNFEFSLDDPWMTGKILGFLAMIYPVTTDHLDIRPSFSEEIFAKGKMNLEGHIRLNHILGFALGLLIRKDFRAFIKRAIALKNSL